MFVSVLQVARNWDNILPVDIRWKFTYINGTFTLYYAGDMTKATELRQKRTETRNFK